MLFLAVWILCACLASNIGDPFKTNIFCFVADDHTRVLLNPIEGVAGSDYINSNFIDVSFEAQETVF